MPLLCPICQKVFEVTFSTPTEAQEFASQVGAHADSHGTAAEYLLVDQWGVPAEESTSEDLQEEKRRMDLISTWVH